MKNIRKSSQSVVALSVTVIIALGTAWAASAGTPSYTVIDLGPVGPNGQPFYVTNNGLVSGGAAVTGGNYHAVVWYRGIETDIGAAGFGGPNNQALGINVRDQAVGLAEVSVVDPYGEDFCGNGTHLVCLPFLSQLGLMSPLPTLGGRNGFAIMINSSGQVAGVSENAAWDPTCPAPQKYQFKPVLWTKGAVQELPTVAGDPEGLAWAINEKGQAAGFRGLRTFQSDLGEQSSVPSRLAVG